jgi:hypothetical protein
MSDGDQRLASLNTARDVFLRALKMHEQFVYKLGYEAGFQAGWEAVVQRLAQTKPDLSLVSNDRQLSELHHDVEIPARDTLLAIVANSPGLERHDIVEMAQKSVTTLSERTLRTALQRLKDIGVLRVDDGKWYVVVKDHPRPEAPISGE